MTGAHGVAALSLLGGSLVMLGGIAIGISRRRTEAFGSNEIS
jgi:LPXTG-motif cell wall-anchored protein